MSQPVNLTEYVQAMTTVKRFKNLFLLLILLSLLFQANTFVMLEFTEVLDSPGETQLDEDEMEESEIPADIVEPKSGGPSFAEVYRKTMFWALPVTKFVALAMGTLLVVAMMYAGALSLLGRGHGTAQLIGAFFWSLILLAMLIPWQQVYSASIACGALYNSMELIQAYDLFHTSEPTAWDTVFFYGRFLAYPALAFLVWLIVAMKFAGGYHKLLVGEPKSTSVGT